MVKYQKYNSCIVSSSSSKKSAVGSTSACADDIPIAKFFRAAKSADKLSGKPKMAGEFMLPYVIRIGGPSEILTNLSQVSKTWRVQASIACQEYYFQKFGRGLCRAPTYESCEFRRVKQSEESEAMLILKEHCEA